MDASHTSASFASCRMVCVSGGRQAWMEKILCRCPHGFKLSTDRTDRQQKFSHPRLKFKCDGEFPPAVRAFKFNGERMKARCDDFFQNFGLKFCVLLWG